MKGTVLELFPLDPLNPGTAFSTKLAWSLETFVMTAEVEEGLLLHAVLMRNVNYAGIIIALGQSYLEEPVRSSIKAVHLHIKSKQTNHP